MVKKLRRYVKPFSSDTGTLRTDGRTDIIAISISGVSVLTRDKNWRLSSRFISTAVQDTAIVTIEDE